MARSTKSPAGFRQSGTRTLVELGVLGVALLVIILALRGCSGWLIDTAVRSIPASVDAAVGKAAAEETRSKYSLLAEPPPVQRRRVEQIFEELRAGLGEAQAATLHNPQVTLVVDEQVNAFALPGGEVFVLTGLIDRVGEDDELLRGVLAHELGHAVRRHGVRSLARKAALSIVAGWLLGDLDQLTASLVAGAAQLEDLSYSREMETEADEFGVELLLRTGRNPEGLARFLDSLEAVPVPELLSTHPDPAERAAAIREQLK